MACRLLEAGRIGVLLDATWWVHCSETFPLLAAKYLSILPLVDATTDAKQAGAVPFYAMAAARAALLAEEQHPQLLQVRGCGCGRARGRICYVLWIHDALQPSLPAGCCT